MIVNNFWLSAQLNLDSLYNYSFLENSLDSARVNKDFKEMADIYYLMGNYQDQVNLSPKKAFDNYTWSLTYYKITNDSSQINKIKHNIALKYNIVGMDDEAIDLLHELESAYIDKKDYKEAILTIISIAKIYHEHSELDLEMQHLEKAKRINNQFNDKFLKVQILLQEIEPLIEYKDYKEGLKKAYYAFELSDNSEFDQSKAIAVFKIGQINLLQKNYDNARKYLQKSLSLSKIIPYDKRRLDCYQYLSQSFEQLETFEQAFKFQKSYSLLNDSILNFDRNQTINNIAIRYEAKEQKVAIQTLEKENIEVQDVVETQKNWFYVLISGLVLLMISGYYLIRYYSHRIKSSRIINNQKEKINSQKIKELEDDIKLSSMQSLIEGQENERQRVAQDLHDSLGGLLSTIKLQYNHFLNKTNAKSKNDKLNDLLDLAVNEVRTISHNLQPESLNRLGLIPAVEDLINRFSIESNPNIDFQKYNITNDLSKMTALNIYRIIQELLNNAVKHSKANEILIQLNEEPDGDILIQFEDDGVGYEIDSIKSSGMGLENIKSRIAYLKGEVEIDSSPGNGTSVLIRVKQKK